MKLKEKLLLSAIGLSTICVMVCPITSKAALQANGNGQVTNTIDKWLLNIRKMEETGGTLGLSDTINTNDLSSSASKSNGLDIHMEKNTEYGAMAILSASAYGNQNVIPDGGTTTGNKSGVVINLNKEFVSAGDLTHLSMIENANSKYKNLYTGLANGVIRKGDAISETQVKNASGGVTGTWHNGSQYWADLGTGSAILRAYSGSLFSYYANGVNADSPSLYRKPNYTRAVIVVGNGF